MARRVDKRNALRTWFRLLLLHKTISKKISAHFRSEFALSTARFDTLAQLHAAGGKMTMGELSAHLMVTSGNVTGVIDGMVEDRLVRRRPHATDRRSIIIAMTPAGRRLFAKVSAALARWIGEAMADMNERELQQLIALFGKLKHSADKWD
ncbi:MAG TPA: MarR family transcriptional regulator [Xanthobacteraceae bacterium]|nr:MarR family transcriptional regulator [Xanthobacteraceae bacterium]